MAIKKCTCKHKYQDKIYGKGNRVHNEIGSNVCVGKLKGYRCTVCENVKK